MWAVEFAFTRKFECDAEEAYCLDTVRVVDFVFTRKFECDAEQTYYIDTVRVVEFYITECSIQVKFCIRHFKSL